MIRPQIFVFAKPARIGLSKTRLAKGMGRTGARRIASWLLSRALRHVQKTNADVILLVTPRDAFASRLGQQWPIDLPIVLQDGGDLTDKLNQALASANPGPVLFVGTDTPDMTPARLRKAIRLLARSDAVFGPSRDGGFWLFGLHKRTYTPSPFGAVRWSGPHAMEDVWKNLPPHANVGLLPQLIDIDDADDLAAWREQQR